MEITEERRGDILILRIIGRLDSSTSKDLEEKVLSLITSSQGKLVIDLTQLDYVSSAGLRVFLLAAKRMDGAKGKMVLCSLKDAVREKARHFPSPRKKDRIMDKTLNRREFIKPVSSAL